MAGGTITDHVTPEEMDRLRALPRGRPGAFTVEEDALVLYGMRAGAIVAEVAAWIGRAYNSVLSRSHTLRGNGFGGEWHAKGPLAVAREPVAKPRFPAPVLARAPEPAKPAAEGFPGALPARWRGLYEAMRMRCGERIARQTVEYEMQKAARGTTPDAARSSKSSQSVHARNVHGDAP